MDMLFITHITGEYTDSGRSVLERPHLLQSEANYKGSQTKKAHVLSATVNDMTLVCTCRKKSSYRTGSPSQKEIRKEF